MNTQPRKKQRYAKVTAQCVLLFSGIGMCSYMPIYGMDSALKKIDAHSFDDALAKDDREAIRVYLESGAQVDDRDENSETLLHKAASRGCIGITELLLEREAFVDAVSYHRPRYGMTPLHLAAQNGHCRVVEALLHGGARTDMDDRNRKRALDLAAENGHQNVVRVIKRLRYILPPLHTAIEKRQKDVVKGLLESGCKVNGVYRGETALHRAARYGPRDVAEWLLDRGARVDALGRDAATPLHRAANFGRRDVVELLLERGARVDAHGSTGWTPIHLAASNNHGDLCTLLASKVSLIPQRSIMFVHEGLFNVLLWHRFTQKLGYPKLPKELLEIMLLSRQEDLADMLLRHLTKHTVRKLPPFLTSDPVAERALEIALRNGNDLLNLLYSQLEGEPFQDYFAPAHRETNFFGAIREVFNEKLREARGLHEKAL